MYAVIQSGAHQYRVELGDELNLQKLDVAVGDACTFDQVLLVRSDDAVQVGRPYVAGATVRAQVLEQGRARKIKVFKFKRRKNYQRLQGHRQHFTRVRIESIDVAGG